LFFFKASERGDSEAAGCLMLARKAKDVIGRGWGEGERNRALKRSHVLVV
jgi:hypothetical protein